MGSSRGGGAYASRKIIDHVALLKEFVTPYVDLGPEMLRAEDRGSPPARLRGRAAITEKYIVRHFSGVQQYLGTGELDNVF